MKCRMLIPAALAAFIASLIVGAKGLPAHNKDSLSVEQRRILKKYKMDLLKIIGGSVDVDNPKTFAPHAIEKYRKQIEKLPSNDVGYPLLVDEAMDSLWRKNSLTNIFLDSIPRAESGGFKGGQFNWMRYVRPQDIVVTNDLKMVKSINEKEPLSKIIERVGPPLLYGHEIIVDSKRQVKSGKALDLIVKGSEWVPKDWKKSRNCIVGWVFSESGRINLKKWRSLSAKLGKDDWSIISNTAPFGPEAIRIMKVDGEGRVIWEKTIHVRIISSYLSP